MDLDVTHAKLLERPESLNDKSLYVPEGMQQSRKLLQTSRDFAAKFTQSNLLSGTLKPTSFGLTLNTGKINRANSLKPQDWRSNTLRLKKQSIDQLDLIDQVPNQSMGDTKSQKSMRSYGSVNKENLMKKGLEYTFKL